MHWRVKGVVQGALGVIPGGVRLNNVLQRTVGELRHFDCQLASKIRDDWLVFMSHLRELDVKPAGLRYLEIGTGWYPALPACFALAGAASCATFDLVRHLDRRLTERMIRLLPLHLPLVAEGSGRPVEEVGADYDTWQSAGDIEEVLRIARIEYHAPADGTNTGLPSDSVDIVYSNSVLEHVPRDAIRALFAESRRVLRPGGLSIHSVNCGDHYAYFDRRISAINYLTYPDGAWKRWNNTLQNQNRLRPQDFLELAEEAGLTVVLRKCAPRPDLLTLLPTLPIAREFRRYPPEELCTTSIDFVARKDRVDQDSRSSRSLECGAANE